MELTVKKACELYKKFTEESDGTVHPIRKYFNLPDCDYCVRISHKIWGKIQLIASYSQGLVHKSKMPALAEMELKQLNTMLAALEKVDIKGIHNELKKLDLIFETTH